MHPNLQTSTQKMLSGWLLYIIQLLLNCYKGWSLCRKWMHLLRVSGSKPGTSSSCPFLLLLLSVNKSQWLTVNESGHGYTQNYPCSSATAQQQLYRINFIFTIYFCLWGSLLIPAEEKPLEELKTAYSCNATLFDRMVEQIYTFYIFTLHYLHILQLFPWYKFL